MSAKTLHFPSPRHLSALYAGREENLVHAERMLGAKLTTREDWLKLEGETAAVEQAERLFNFLDRARAQGMAIRTPDFHRIVDAFATSGDAWGAWVGLAYTVVLGTVVGSGIWTWLMARHPASTVAPFSMLVPVVGISAAWLEIGRAHV